MPDIDINTMIWGIFDHQENLRATKKTNFDKVKQVFDTSQKLILNQKGWDIWNIDDRMEDNSLEENVFATRQSSHAVESKVNVYTDSLLCLGKFHEHLHSIEARKPKLEWFMKSREYRELDGIDEEPVEFEWKKFPGHTTLELLREIQRTLAENRIQPELFKDRIIFMSMCNDIDWT